MKTFIKDAVKMLGNLNDPNRNSYLIHAYLNTPVIQDITFDGKDTFKIFSEEYGEFVFRLANEFYSKYDKLNEYMSTKRHKVCFANASMVMMENVDCNVIVSLLPSYFVDYYYHAYNYFKKSNEVLDLCSNMFMDKDSYDLLYEPIEVFNMTDRDAAKLFFSEVKDIESEIKVDLLKLAIYVQLQNMDEEQKKRILYSNNKFTY